MNLKTKLFAVLPLLVGALILTPTRARANSFTGDVAVQLINALYGAGLNGYESTHDPYVNMLYHGGSGYVNINLDAGKSYGIVGVCDRDCTDLDITVYDQNGNVVGYDNDNDDTPVVGFTPRRSGTYQVKVDMPHCGTGACYYGVGVFGR